MSTRREILTGILVLLAAPGAATAAAADPLATAWPGAKPIAESFRAGRTLDPRKAQAALLPDGWTTTTPIRLRRLIADDYRRGRTFGHQGWRLSDTEGRLFLILAAGA